MFRVVVDDSGIALLSLGQNFFLVGQDFLLIVRDLL